MHRSAPQPAVIATPAGGTVDVLAEIVPGSFEEKGCGVAEGRLTDNSNDDKKNCGDHVVVVTRHVGLSEE